MFDVFGSFVAAILSMVLGFAWYSEAFLGKRWRKEMGFTREDAEKMKKADMKKPVILGFLSELVTALVFSYFFIALGVNQNNEALAVAFWAWLGFSATLQFGGTVWGKDSMTLFFINSMHRLASFVLIALTLVLL